MAGTDAPPTPTCSFASDNAAGASPEVLEAIVAANAGPALAYGDDPWTEAAHRQLRDLFDAPVEVLLCWGGTGANTVGLAALLSPWQSVLCVDTAPVVVDECGGPARFTGSLFATVPAVDGKLVPGAIADVAHLHGQVHHPQPRVATVSQVTEAGTIYTVDELGALADACHAQGMVLHVDGARLANAVAATGSDVRSMVRDTGVDVLTFGFTKNGAIGAEAIVFLRPELADHAHYVRKQAGQLVSKSRFVAAQVSALLTDDLWLRNAAHANAMAARLAAGARGVPGVDVPADPAANGVFATVPWDRLDDLLAWSFFWPWDPATSTVRWMTSWATTTADVDAFVAGLRQLLGPA